MVKKTTSNEIKVFIYKGGSSVVKKSGIGMAINHQGSMLEKNDIVQSLDWKDADIIHFNTVLPDSFLMAVLAKLKGKYVIYFGHSTKEDFKNSFIGSNIVAGLFKKWICICYGIGDIIITPTPYSKKLLEGYKIKRPIYALTNGVDTDYFYKDHEARRRFRQKYHLSDDQKVVISVGLLIKRKGILDFIEVAKTMPDVCFVWFGDNDMKILPEDIKEAIKNSPKNIIYAGYVDQSELRDAYCGADAFTFFSYEETEGIVVLEALACEIPVVLRDIPVYADWLKDGIDVHKASDNEGFKEKLGFIFTNDHSEMKKAERTLAERYSLYQTGKTLKEIYGSLIKAKVKVKSEGRSFES